MTAVGSNIRRIRKELGMSQNALGRAIGHEGGRYISAIEGGQKHPGDEMLTRIARALDVDVSELRKNQ